MLRLAKDIIETRIGDELIILELDSGNYLRLNQTASIIWDFLKEGKTTEQVKKIFLEKYPDSNEIELDVDEFIAQAKNAKILT